MTLARFYILMCAYTIIVVSSLTIVGHLFDHPRLAKWVGVDGMAFNTAINFILVGSCMILSCGKHGTVDIVEVDRCS